MRTFTTAVHTLFPVVTEIESEPRQIVSRQTHRASGLLGQVVAVSCALTPLMVMIEAWRQTI